MPSRMSGAGVVDDHLADDVTAAERGERVLDLLEPDPVADHALEVEPAGPPEGDQAGEVARRVGRAVQRRDDPLALEEQLERAELDLVLGPAGADQDDGAAPADRGPRRTQGLWDGDHVEGVIEPLARGDL